MGEVVVVVVRLISIPWLHDEPALLVRPDVWVRWTSHSWFLHSIGTVRPWFGADAQLERWASRRAGRQAAKQSDAEVLIGYGIIWQRVVGRPGLSSWQVMR